MTTTSKLFSRQVRPACLRETLAAGLSLAVGKVARSGLKKYVREKTYRIKHGIGRLTGGTGGRWLGLRLGLRNPCSLFHIYLQ